MYYKCDSSKKKKKKEKKKFHWNPLQTLPFQLLQLSVRGSGKRRCGLGWGCARNPRQLLLKETVTLDGTASSSIWNQQVQYRLTCLQGRSLIHLGQLAFLRSVLWIFGPVLLVKDSWGSGMRCSLSCDCPDQIWLTEEWVFLYWLSQFTTIRSIVFLLWHLGIHKTVQQLERTLKIRESDLLHLEIRKLIFHRSWHFSFQGPMHQHLEILIRIELLLLMILLLLARTFSTLLYCRDYSKKVIWTQSCIKSIIAFHKNSLDGNTPRVICEIPLKI